VIVPSVNRILTIEPNCENIILDFTVIFNNENNSKFNIFCTLCPKISKSPSLNPTHGRFSNNTENAPKYPYKF
jgi:hypothetical protein